MNRKIELIIKSAVFSIIFVAISFLLSFILKNNINSYARTLFNEFYRQEKVDILFWGASHISHGINPQIADSMLNASTYNTGTPSQRIEATYAIIEQAIKLYDLKKIYLEIDFAVVSTTSFKDSKGFKANYIVGENIKDLKVKYNLYKTMSSPKYYLNHILPIGKDKMISLNPKDIVNKIRAIISGAYYRAEYSNEDTIYAGKGCVMDLNSIEDGTFSNNSFEKPIPIKDFVEDWKSMIKKIINKCEENKIELVFFSMPQSDFYLNEKSNFDDFHFYIKNFLAENNYDYYDFCLANPDILPLKDHHYSDDNHLSKDGVELWTNVFFKWASGEISDEEMFFSSYEEKMKKMASQIFGLILSLEQDTNNLKITSIDNNNSNDVITYDVNYIIDGETIPVAINSRENTFSMPSNKTLTLEVFSYLNDKQQNHCKEIFTVF